MSIQTFEIDQRGWLFRGVMCLLCEPAGEFVFLSVSQEHDVETPYGMLHVVIRGAPKGNKPAIITYHDVGLNREYPLQKK